MSDATMAMDAQRVNTGAITRISSGVARTLLASELNVEVTTTAAFTLTFPDPSENGGHPVLVRFDTETSGNLTVAFPTDTVVGGTDSYALTAVEDFVYAVPAGQWWVVMASKLT